MLEQLNDQIRRCYERAAEAKAKADATDDPALKAENFTVEQFNDLTGRILNEATKNDTPIDAALSAIARALGLMISILAQRPGVSVEQFIKLSQDGVAEYARDALAKIANKRGP